MRTRQKKELVAEEFTTIDEYNFSETVSKYRIK